MGNNLLERGDPQQARRAFQSAYVSTLRMRLFTTRMLVCSCIILNCSRL